MKIRRLILRVKDEEIVVDINQNSESHSNIYLSSLVPVHCFDHFVKEV